MKRGFLAAVLVAVVAALTANLPPPRQTLGKPFSDGTVAGVLHVHTSRSDGSGTPEEIAAAAARAGAAFVILTDHGDGTRVPDPPIYRSGVLCLDAVEISTRGGHYIAIDMPAAPYPLGGEARDVVEDVRRLGGFGVAAHPDSPDAELAWSDPAAPVDGYEWLNLDTSWRARAWAPGWRAPWHLIEALAAYPFRRHETIARLAAATPPDTGRWAALSLTRRLVLLAGADAHGELPLGTGEQSVRLRAPGYESVFRAVSLRVLIDGQFTGDAAADAATLVSALRGGRAYTAIDGLAGEPAFQFTATNARGRAVYGDLLEAGGPVTLRVASNAPPSFTTVLLKDERPIASARGGRELVRSEPDVPAVYRVEIRAPSKDGATPWLVSNPIHVGTRSTPDAPHEPLPVTSAVPLFDRRTVSGWKIEADADSRGQLEVEPGTPDGALLLRYALAERTAGGPFVALVAAVPSGAAAVDRLAFRAAAERPARVSVNLRNTRGEQWSRSVYLDATPRDHLVALDEMRPAGVVTSPRPAASDIKEVLFVFESTHTPPGSAGWLRIDSAALHGHDSGAHDSERRR